MLSEPALRDLYLNQKVSVSVIAKRYKCSERKINYWLLKYNIPKRSISEALYQKYNPKGDPFNIKEVNSIEDAKLMGLGLGLYWGEGNKKNKNTIRLGNTDPHLIKKFLHFLIRILRVETKKIRFGLQVFSDMSKDKVLLFWLNELHEFKISPQQFFKVIITPARSLGTYREKSQYGVLTVYFCNVKLKKILDSMLPL